MRTITIVVITVTMFVLGYKIGQRLNAQVKPCPTVDSQGFDCMKLDGRQGWDYKLCYRFRKGRKKS